LTLYRTGTRDDCPRLAELIHEASAGIADYLYEGLVPGSTSVEILARGLTVEDHPHGYRNTVVAEAGGGIVGVTLSYPAEEHRITPAMQRFFPAERLEGLRPLYEARVEGSWFLDAMSVDPEFRRRQIGLGLVERTKETARRNGYGVLSLLVFEDNTPAVGLYLRTGFEVVREVRIGRIPRFRYQGVSLLMKADLEGRPKGRHMSPLRPLQGSSTS